MANPQSICRGTYQEDERVHLEDGGDKIVINSGGTLEVKAGATVTGISGSGSPGGADTQVQFNDGGAFGGDAGLTFDKVTQQLTQTNEITGGYVATDAVQDNRSDVFPGGMDVATYRDISGTGGANSFACDTFFRAMTGNVSALSTALDIVVAAEVSPTFTMNGLSAINIRPGTFAVTGTLTDYYGVKVEDLRGKGTNNYAIHIANQGTGATDKAIFIAGGNSDLGPNTTSVGQLRVTAPAVPASAGATGVAGTIAWDADFLYVCIATNTWKRAALSTW